MLCTLGSSDLISWVAKFFFFLMWWLSFEAMEIKHKRNMRADRKGPTSLPLSNIISVVVR